MVTENTNNINNSTTTRKVGIFSALKAIFASDDEKLVEDAEMEIKKLNEMSEKNIKAIEENIFSNGTAKKEKMSNSLKVEDNKLNKKSTSKKNVGNVEKDETEKNKEDIER